MWPDSNPFSYIFNANDTAGPQSFEALQMRRKIAEQMAAQKRQPYPKNIGEGISSAADSLAGAWDQRNLEKRLAAYAAQRQGRVDQYSGNQSYEVPLPTVPRPAVPGRRADMSYPQSSVADLGQPPAMMGGTLNTADYNLHRPEDDYGYG
jgi:hypothetical protein